MSNILVIAPHADDEILGCGGSINFFIRKGYKVYVAILTNGNKGDKKKYSEKYIDGLRKEALKSHKYLGISKTFFFEFPAPYLDQYPIAKISDSIKKLIEKINPQKLFIPHLHDSHVDHQIIHKASLVAARPIGKVKIEEVYSYETLSETEWGSKNKNFYFIPNQYIIINKKDLIKKLSAFKFYKSQIKKNNHPRSLKSIEALAINRGSNISEKYAEAFIMLRKILK